MAHVSKKRLFDKKTFASINVLSISKGDVSGAERIAPGNQSTYLSLLWEECKGRTNGKTKVDSLKTQAVDN